MIFNQYNLPPLEERFMSYVSPEPMSGCWLWLGPLRDKKGYGGITVDGQEWRAHRLSYQLFRGAIPRGLHVLHKCDNKTCVNPSHLFLGTNLDNVADAVSKQRHRRGSANPKTKITEDDVRAIRSSPLGCKRLARIYGMKSHSIIGIRQRRTWKHV